MPTINNTIHKAGGLAQDDFNVTVTLSWDTSLSPVARSTTGDVMFVGSLLASTDANGYWSAVVQSNDDIEPAGSVYKVTEAERGSSTVVSTYYISVPSVESEYWVGDIIAATPAWEEEE